MRKETIVSILIFISVLLVGGFGPALAQQDNPVASEASSRTGTKCAEGEILVKFKETASVKASVERTSPKVLSGSSHLSSGTQKALNQVGAQVKKAYLKTGIHLLSVPQHLTMEQTIDELYQSGEVEFAEPNYLVHVDRTPSDPLFSDQWALQNLGPKDSSSSIKTDADIDATEAWQRAINASNTIVVVLDTGVDYTHEDLAANIWTNPGEKDGQTGIDDDHNGYVDDLHGINTADSTSDPMDIDGHGTHCAGTIGAAGNNGTGIAGIGWKAQIMPLKFMTHETGYINRAIECINYALAIKEANNYPRMIFNISWGFEGTFPQSLYNAFVAAQEAGVIMVCSAGNGGKNADVTAHWPSSFNMDNIIRVGASDANDQKASFSNYGITAVDVFAPGVEILSTMPGNTYEKFSGTSAATPFVTGACALLWSLRSDLSWDQIKANLLNGIENGKTPGALLSKCRTNGRLNLANAMQVKNKNLPGIFSISPSTGQMGDAITLTGWGLTNVYQLQFLNTQFPYQPTEMSYDGKSLTLQIPEGLPFGVGLLKLVTWDGTNRGVAFRSGLVPKTAGMTMLDHAFAASAQIGQDVWIIGGLTSAGQTPYVEHYDLQSGSSNYGPVVPTALTYSSAAAIRGKIYVVGGMDWTTKKASNKLQIFDTFSKQWGKGRNFPFFICQSAAVAMDDDRLYVFGGTNGAGKAVNTTYIYNPDANTWTAGAPIPTATTLPTAVRIEGTPYIMLMGGSSKGGGGRALNLVQIYNTETNEWQAGPNLLKARYGAASVFSKSAFCMFGAGNNDTGIVDGEYLNDTKWQTALFPDRSLLGAIALKYFGNIFVIGGKNPATGACSNTVWSFQYGSSVPY